MVSKTDFIAPKLIIDFEDLRHNVAVLRDQIAEQNPEFMAVVKANAYGMGLVGFVGALMQNGIREFAVATLWEAQQLRETYPDISLLVLGAVPPALVPLAVDLRSALTITSLDTWREVERVAAEKGVKHPIHVKVNTGLNRLGFPLSQAEAVKRFLETEVAHSDVIGVYTHLALSTREEDDEQVLRFRSFLEQTGLDRRDGVRRHVCDSIAAIDYPEYRFDMVRIGAALLGVKSYRYPDLPTRLIARLTSIITHINELEVGDGVSYDYTFRAERPSRIAAVQIGYADGLPRSLSNRGFVEVEGKRAPIVGIMCMDQIMIDVTDCPEARVGSVVTLFGREGAAPTLEEIAEWADTNRNEIFARIGERVQREWR